ncbi:MAG: transporter [Lysobacterales bacterium]
MRDLPVKLRVAFIVILCPLTIAKATAAPITFNTALPVGKGEFVNREQLVLTRAGKDSSGAGREVEGTALVSVLAYGIRGNLTLFGILPYVDKKLRYPGPGAGSVKRSSRGIGDSSVFLRYTFHQNDRQGSTFRVAAFAGIKIPTGSDTQRDSLGLLPVPLQSGTGSWDGFGGIVTTYQELSFQVDAQLSYTVKTQANQFQTGNEARLDGSFQYRLFPRELQSGVPAYVYGVLETNFIYRDKNTFLGQADPNSGGTTIFLAPGIQYVTRRYILEAAVQIPVVQNLNGSALENDYVARTGFRWNF